MSKIRYPAHDSVAYGLGQNATGRLRFYNEAVLPTWGEAGTLTKFTEILARKFPKQVQLIGKILETPKTGLSPAFCFRALFPSPRCVCGNPLTKSSPLRIYCSENCSRYHRDGLEYASLLHAKHGINSSHVGSYRGLKTPTDHLCSGCNTVFSMSPRQLLSRTSGYCIECHKRAQSAGNRLSENEFRSRMKRVHEDRVTLVSKFSALGEPASFRCISHGVFDKSRAGWGLKPFACPECWRENASKNALDRIRSRRKRGRYKLKKVVIEGRPVECQGYEPQAIKWILDTYPDININDFSFDNEGGVPIIKYRLGRMRTYFPDFFIKKLNLVIEVKSSYTLGLNTGKGWRKNQEKAKAVKAAGFKFALLLMDGKGTRIGALPEDWESKTRTRVLIEMAASRADVIPKGIGVKRFQPTNPTTYPRRNKRA